MAKYVTDVEFKEQVRVCLDQNMSSDALAALEDVDTLSLDDIIESKAEDAALSVLKSAPIYKLGDISKLFDGDISISPKKPYKVSKTLPKGFARLVRFNMESWRYPIHEALPPFTSLYDQANSGFNTFGTKDRPAAFLVPTDGGKKLEVFCAKDLSDAMDGCTYAAKPEWEEIIYPVTGITLSESSASIGEGRRITLTATIHPSYATNKNVTWESDDEEVATVDANGVVTGVSEGNCTITCKATDGSGVEATCSCEVEPVLVSDILLSSDSLNISANVEHSLTAVVLPDDATNKNLLWDSDDEGIATVNENGVVKGISQGNCSITCSATDGSGVSAMCECTVSAVPAVPVTGISISFQTTGSGTGTINDPIEINAGETITFTATVSPDNATDGSVTWESPWPGVSLDIDGLTCVATAESRYAGWHGYVSCVANDGSGVESQKVSFHIRRAVEDSNDTPVVAPPADNDAEEFASKRKIQLADDLVRPTIYYAAYLTALEVKDDNAAEKLLAIAKSLIEN